MAQKAPWHSAKQNVHLVCSNCNTGNNIEREPTAGHWRKATMLRML